MYVVGGAAMALVYDARRVTRDIDSVVLDGCGPLTEEVRAIATERRLPTTWLKEQASSYVSPRPDIGQSRVFDHANLTVAAASAEHLLAMKLLAGRASDVGDLRLLLRILAISDRAGAELVLETVFPGSVLSERARLIVEDIIAADG